MKAKTKIVTLSKVMPTYKWNRKQFIPYLFIAPFFVSFAIFWIGPIIFTFIISLTDWVGLKPAVFTGFANYGDLLRDSRFLIALKNNFVYALSYNTVMICLALLLALALNSTLVYKSTVFRTIYFIPVTISLAIVAILFDLIYHRDIGLLNIVLGMLGLPHGFDWFKDPKLALLSIVMLDVWRTTGYYAVILLAGLKAVPREIIEAAKIDGASGWQVTVRVTLPILRPIIAFVVIMSSIWSLQLFEVPWIVNKGGPIDATLTLVQYLYQTGFSYSKLGYGASVSFVLTAILLVISSIQVRALGIAKEVAE